MDNTKAVVEPTEQEWNAIVNFDGAWERLQAAVERYGQRVAREAYALGRLRENTAIDRSLAEAFSAPSAAVIPVASRVMEQMTKLPRVSAIHIGETGPTQHDAVLLRDVLAAIRAAGRDEAP